MTNEEAIGFLQSRIDLIDKCYPDVKDYREALVTAIKALEQEPCEDCISRQAAIDAIFGEPLYESEMKKRYAEGVVPAIFEKIKSLQSVTPQPKVGEWLKNGELCKCSNCHSNVLFSAIKLYNYCYHCGAKMEVSE